MSPLITLSLPIVPLIDFTLSNARRFYSSMGNPTGVKGLKRLLRITGKVKSLTSQEAHSAVCKYVKVSYSCMDNMKSIINKHNKKVTNADTNTDNQVQCNCRNKDQCPLDNKCLTSNVIYNAQVTTNNATKNYIGLTEGTFKQRFSQHKATFKHRKYTNSTELSKYIWKLRDNNQDFNIKWTIISRARPYSNISKRCDLCLTEKLMIITANPGRILNKRSEMISKCRHENKFYLRNN